MSVPNFRKGYHTVLGAAIDFPLQKNNNTYNNNRFPPDGGILIIIIISWRYYIIQTLDCTSHHCVFLVKS